MRGEVAEKPNLGVTVAMDKAKKYPLDEVHSLLNIRECSVLDSGNQSLVDPRETIRVMVELNTADDKTSV